jgi:hypothetical protein
MAAGNGKEPPMSGARWGPVLGSCSGRKFRAVSGAAEVTVTQMDRVVAAADQVRVARHQDKGAGLAGVEERGFEFFECLDLESVQSLVHQQ